MASPMLDTRTNETKTEAIDMLNKYGKCVILRPTGFGKTFIMAHIAAEPKYEKVLYVYPSDAVWGTAKGHFIDANALDKVEFMTYKKVGMLSKDPDRLIKTINDKYDLVIFDELHHAGAELVKKCLYAVLDKLDNVDILGGTATPKRMDGFDVIGKMFDNKIVKFYGLDNAITDGIMPKPHYVYATDGYKVVEDALKQKISKIPSEMITEKNKVSMKKGIKQLSRLTNASSIIKESIINVYKGNLPEYMRFMVFFPDKNELNKRKDEVINWFKDAFRWYNVNSLVIHSSYNEKQNLKVLEELPYIPGQIDVIMSINMLNEGYHVEKVTGVVLLRPTQSPTVYTQQIGRCMKVDMNYTPIIFDFVANIKIHSIFDMNTKKIEVDDTDDLTEAEIEVEEQIKKLNSLSACNIHMDNKVADVKKVISKISHELPKDVEISVIKDRMSKIKYPATELAEKHKIDLWEVYNILDKYEYMLKPLGLHKQTADFYDKGNKKTGKKVS